MWLYFPGDVPLSEAERFAPGIFSNRMDKAKNQAAESRSSRKAEMNCENKKSKAEKRRICHCLQHHCGIEPT